MKKKFINGHYIPTQHKYNYSNYSVPCVLPNRAYSIADLSYRLEKGLPLPNLTLYQNYEDTGLTPQVTPTDLISAYNMAKQIKSNEQQKQQLIMQQKQQQQLIMQQQQQPQQQ